MGIVHRCLDGRVAASNGHTACLRSLSAGADPGSPLGCAGLGAGTLSGLGGPGDLAGGLTYGPPPSNAASDLGLGLTYGPPPVGGMGMAPLSGGAGGAGIGGPLSGSGLDYGPRPPMQTGAAAVAARETASNNHRAVVCSLIAERMAPSALPYLPRCHWASQVGLYRFEGRSLATPQADAAGGFGAVGNLDHTSMFAATGGAAGGLSLGGFGASANDFGDLQVSN